MTSLAPRSIRTAAFLAALVLAVPGATAVENIDLLDGEVRSLQHHGVLREQGSLDLFRFVDDEAFGTPDLRLVAQSLWAIHFTSERVRVDPPDAGDLQTGQTYVNYPGNWHEPAYFGTSEDPLQRARVHSVGGQPAFEVRVLPLDPERDATSINARLGGSTSFEALPEAHMTSFGGIESGEPADYGSSPEDDRQPVFITRAVDRPVAVSRSTGSDLSVLIHGDFILEVRGLDAVLAADGRNDTLRTGTDAEGTAPAENVKRQMLRVFVQDGTLELHHRSVNTTVEWAMASVQVFGDDGAVMLEGTQGPQDVRFRDGYAGTLTPRGDALALALTQSSGPYGPSASIWLAPSGFNPIPIAAALLAVALVTLTVRTLRTPPPLAHMESALEAGSFSRAARLAGRILRKDPTRESAHLGRAIALSRSGRPERVVRALQPYLDGNEPSDGTLHYVLGLAYQDLGKERDAAKALSEAVRRTPALAQQVGEVPEPQQWSAPESDAQGYT